MRGISWVVQSMVAVLLATSAGCSSNLWLRPDWAESQSLPDDDPLAAQYPKSRYLSIVSTGAGKDVGEARATARRNAVEALADQVGRAATAAFCATAPTEPATTADDRRTRVSAICRAASSEAVQEPLEVHAWEGYEGSLSHYFGCYVASRDKATDVVVARARAAAARLEEACRRLSNGSSAEQDSDAGALEALGHAFEIAVLRQLCKTINGTADSATIPDPALLETAATDVLHTTGEAWEAKGSEAALMAALDLYRKATVLRPSTRLEASLGRVQGRLPCSSCKGSLAQAQELDSVLAEAYERLTKEDPQIVPGIALDALSSLRRYEQVRTHGCPFFAERSGNFRDHSSLSDACLKTIRAAGQSFEASGTEEDLLKALKTYQEAANVAPQGGLTEDLERVRGRLPCPECKGMLSNIEENRQLCIQFEAKLDELRSDATGRQALSVVRATAAILQLRQHPCNFFKERIAKFEDFTNLERSGVEALYATGQAYEQTGTDEALESALRLYVEGLTCRPSDEELPKRIEDVKKRLPCKECARTGQCVRCKGEKGAQKTCSTCRGSTQVRETCPACGGDGRTQCVGCGGGGEVEAPCGACSGGRQTCSNCRGQGEVEKHCPWCLGGKTAYGQTCSACGGTKRLSEACFGCYRKGTVECRRCRGNTVVNVRCSTCGGRGRSGQCSNCSGARTVIVDCPVCPDGKVWVDCERCSASGVCPTCSGEGHRR
jgi:tetratricopeptide (TPR) repeat protein